MGASNEGYWTYNHMSIQFEDCVDWIKVIYPYFRFCVRSFARTRKKLTGGLDAYRINKKYGGAQPMMRESSMIKDHDGYLGMHEHILHIGDTQSFVFTSNVKGPFWMSPEKRELNRHDRMLPATPGTRKLRNKTIVTSNLSFIESTF